MITKSSTVPASELRRFYTILVFTVPISAMVQPAHGVLRSDRCNGLGDSRIQGFSRACLQRSQDQLDLGPAFFDGVEMGRIRREIKQAGAGSLDSVPHHGSFVSAQIVHNDDVPGLQFGA